MFFMLCDLLLLNECGYLSSGKGPVGVMGCVEENFIGDGVGILWVIGSFGDYIFLSLLSFPLLEICSST